MDLPARFGLASLSVLGPLDNEDDGASSLGSSMASSHHRSPGGDAKWGAGGGDSRTIAAAITARHSPPQQIMRHCVSIVNELTHSPDCCETIISSQILMHVLQASMTTFRRDRKIGRTVSAMVRRLTLVIRGLPGAQPLLETDDRLLTGTGASVSAARVLKGCCELRVTNNGQDFNAASVTYAYLSPPTCEPTPQTR